MLSIFPTSVVRFLTIHSFCNNCYSLSSCFGVINGEIIVRSCVLFDALRCYIGCISKLSLNQKTKAQTYYTVTLHTSFAT